MLICMNIHIACAKPVSFATAAHLKYTPSKPHPNPLHNPFQINSLTLNTPSNLYLGVGGWGGGGGVGGGGWGGWVGGGWGLGVAWFVATLITDTGKT